MNRRIKFSCPSCGAQLSARKELVGRRGPCPHCAAEVMVPPRIPNEQPSVLIMDDESDGSPLRRRRGDGWT